jgi:hypothetical protein
MIKLKDILKEDFKQVVATYVNNFQDKGLVSVKDQIPNNLKYAGIAYHICPFSKKDIQAVINGETISYPAKKILSWSKSIKGLTNTLHNLQTDSPGKFNNALIIKQKITKDKCIVDIPAFAAEYEGIISNTQYANYKEEEEVITVNFLTTISKDMVDGYVLNGKATKML